MQYKFNKHLSEILPKSAGRINILVAVSGGADSMCLLDLLHNSSLDLNIAAAHVNFNLRGEESCADEEFVREWTSAHSIKCFVKSVDTISYARKNSLSIEMAAREIRYNWFFSLKEEYNFDYIAVAHHSNDNAETLLLNLIRGTGIAGASGMKELDARTSVIRPLLSYSRQSIEKYLQQRGIPYRTDHTNLENDFARNRIRNEVIPQLEKINPSAVATINRSMRHFGAVASIMERLHESKRLQLCSYGCEADSPFMTVVKSRVARLYMQKMLGRDLVCHISVEELIKEQEYDYWLYVFLKEYGFNPTQLDDLATALENEDENRERKFILSSSHLAVKERGYIKVYRKEILDCYEPVPIEMPFGEISLSLPSGLKLDLRITDRENACRYMQHETPLTVGNAPVRLMADADKLNFPLILRSVEAGDRFRPFGMNGVKKINDYLSDLKIDTVIKSVVPVLCDGTKKSPDSLVCVPGLQISNSYRVTDNTVRCLIISIS
ncbi:MAG: tRNA lysidine(34) synthetase TilS [Bacteroidales bacterium]|nr:tRNA lysidine(34) synthetase TilS [Bacteroidales bacterium]